MVYFFYCDKDGYARIEKGVKMRLNKYLSDAGVCSRREADRMIQEGRITVNGEEAVRRQEESQ